MTARGGRTKQSVKSPLINKMPCPSIDTQVQSYPKLINKFEAIANLQCQYDQAFTLRPCSKYCYHQKVIADFMPKPSDKVSLFVSSPTENTKLKDKRIQKMHAVYNRDGRHYTPAFVVGRELINYINEPSQDLQKFKEKVKDAELKARQEPYKSKIEVLIPKPNGNKCQICKCQFQQYSEHIAEEKHKDLIKKSKGWIYSSDLIKQFQQRNQKQVGKKQKKIKIEQRRKPGNVKQDIERLMGLYSNVGDKMKTKPISKQQINKKKSGRLGKLSGVSATYATQN